MVSKGWIKKLLEETKQWVSEGIIDEAQKQRISSRYSERPEYSRLLNIVVTLGSILIGLGILLFVASNWDKLSRPAKITIIFSVISAFNFAGYYFRQVKDEFPGLGEGFLLIGAFSFGAGIWLIAQIYQIHYNFSAGILFWILGILPFVYIHRSWTILALSSILCYIWLASYQEYYPERAGYGFFLLAAAIIALCYQRKQKFSLFVMIAALSAWLLHFWMQEHIVKGLFSQNNLLTPQLFLVAILANLGFILYALGIGHEKTSRFAGFSFLYKFLGTLFICLSTYSVTFAHHYHKDSFFYIPLKTSLLIILQLAAALFIFSRLLRLTAGAAETKETKIVIWFFLLQLLATFFSLLWPPIASLSFNLILLVQALGFLYIGFLRHTEGIVRLAIFIFFLDILSRYFDIFWKMMPRSLLFIFGGAMLIAGATFINRKRKQIEEAMLKR